jgi:hypothetical protein
MWKHPGERALFEHEIHNSFFTAIHPSIAHLSNGGLTNDHAGTMIPYNINPSGKIA